jgi:hypothetical protein
MSRPADGTVGSMRAGSSRRLRVRWIPRWSSSIADAVQALPVGRLCSPELYATLLERSLRHDGRVAVVERGDDVVAVVGLQRDGRIRWKPVANWIIPDLVCAAADADVLPALAALGKEIAVSWWRRAAEPQGPVRERHRIPTHVLEVAEREAYWRSTGRWRGVVKARERTDGLSLTIDEPGGYEWVVRSGAAKFTAGDQTRFLTLEEQLLSIGYLESVGRHVTIVLRDGDRRLSGEAAIVDGDALVSVLAYRDESVGSLPTGVRTLDALFTLAEERGLREVDLGGTRPYKTAWAPVDGVHDELLVAPALAHRGRALAKRLLSRR